MDYTTYTTSRTSLEDVDVITVTAKASDPFAVGTYTMTFVLDARGHDFVSFQGDHLVIGDDTSALPNPVQAGLDHIVETA